MHGLRAWIVLRSCWFAHLRFGKCWILCPKRGCHRRDPVLSRELPELDRSNCLPPLSLWIVQPTVRSNYLFAMWPFHSPPDWHQPHRIFSSWLYLHHPMQLVFRRLSYLVRSLGRYDLVQPVRYQFGLHQPVLWSLSCQRCLATRIPHVHRLSSRYRSQHRQDLLHRGLDSKGAQEATDQMCSRISIVSYPREQERIDRVRRHHQLARDLWRMPWRGQLPRLLHARQRRLCSMRSGQVRDPMSSRLQPDRARLRKGLVRTQTFQQAIDRRSTRCQDHSIDLDQSPKGAACHQTRWAASHHTTGSSEGRT
jgi:hypothetical protein